MHTLQLKPRYEFLNRDAMLFGLTGSAGVDLLAFPVWREALPKGQPVLAEKRKVADLL